MKNLKLLTIEEFSEKLLKVGFTFFYKINSTFEIGKIVSVEPGYFQVDWKLVYIYPKTYSERVIYSDKYVSTCFAEWVVNR